MFHEVAYPWHLRDRPTRWLLAAGHRWMARTLLKAATHVDVTTPAWERLLRAVRAGRPPRDRLAAGAEQHPGRRRPGAVAAVRRRVAPAGRGGRRQLQLVLRTDRPAARRRRCRGLLTDRPDRVGLLIGQGGDRLAARLVAEHPELAGRLSRTGPLTPAEVSAHLQACDL